METILIVDDNPTNLEVLFKTLDQPDYRILVARSGESALQIVEQELPTLALLDIMMPGMDGFEVCRRIKADPKSQQTAVIFLSALGDTQAKVKGFQLGGVDYIAKPFQAEEVVARVATHIHLQQLERELQQRNLELESQRDQILSSMEEGVFGIDTGANITYANTAALALTGYTEADVQDKNLFDLLIAGGPSADWLQSEPMVKLAEQEVVSAKSLWVCCKAKEKFAADVCLTPNLVGEELHGAVMVFRDVTAQLEAEALLAETQDQLQHQRQQMAHVERLTTMGEMAAGFAHEVNQPLTAIANYASVAIRLLTSDPVDKSRTEETLRKLQTQAIRASDVIQRLRGFARTPKENKVVVDMNAVLAAVVDLAEVDSRKAEVSIALEPTIEPAMVYVDEVQIQQVALNLLRNAMEATAQAQNNQQAVIIATEQDEDTVTLSVRDYGVGLGEDAEDRLFSPFYSTKPKGMGVGLSVCSSIVAEHAGEIGFSRQSPGTLFWVKLPRQR